MLRVFDNAIVFAQFRLKGGLRTLLFVSGLSAVGIAALMSLTVQVNPDSPTRTLAGWVGGLLVLQALLLLLVGSSRVARAVRKDLASGMLESHRLMPIAPIHAVCGYIVGGCSMLLAVWLVLFVAGLVAQSLAGGPVQYWVLANLLLLSFAAFWWCLVVFSTLFFGGASLLVGLLIAGVWFSGGQILWLIPATGVLASSLLSVSIFDVRLVDRVDWPLAVSLLAQASFGSVFLYGAGRCFRSESQPVLGVRGTLLLLLVWCAISAVGLQWQEAFAPSWMASKKPVDSIIEPSVVSLFSLSVSALLTLPVLVAATGASARWRTRRRFGEPDLPRAPVAPIWSALACVGMVGSLLALPRVQAELELTTIIRLEALVGVFVLMMLGVMQLLDKPRAPRALLALIVLLGWSLVPFAVGLLLRATSATSNVPIGEILAWSPPVALSILLGVIELPASAVDVPLLTAFLLATLLLARGARLGRRAGAWSPVAADSADR